MVPGSQTPEIKILERNIHEVMYLVIIEKHALAKVSVTPSQNILPL